MANPLSPASLPQKPLMSGFSETMPNLVVRSQTDTGPAKVRVRATDGATSFDSQFRMTAAQLATFRTFFTTDLKAGTLAFDWKHPITNASRAFRVIDAPKIAPGGASWLVSLRIEMLP